MTKKVLTYLYIAFNGLVSALAYELFVIPNNFAPAGVGGICTMIQYVFDINVGYMNLLVNLPLAVAVYFLVSKPMSVRAFIYTCFFSGFMVLFDYIDLTPFIYHTDNGTSTVLGPLVGGIIMGWGSAQMLKLGTFQGGIYYVSVLVKKYAPHFNFFWVSFALNAVIAVTSYFVYQNGLEPVLLSVLYFFTSTMVNSTLTKKTHSALRCEIITEYPEQLSKAIIEKLHHSATLLPGKGIYRGKETSVLICIINNTQAVTLSAILKEYPDTFAVMSQVDEVLGNFKRLDNHGKLEMRMFDVGDTRVD